MADILGVAPQVVSEGSDAISTGSAVNRRARLAGLLIVLAVAVLPFLISSTMRVVGITPTASDSYVVYRFLNALLIELTSLALLLYVLHQNGQSLGEIGLRFQFGDIGHGIVLILGCRLVFRIARLIMIWFYELRFGHAPPSFTSPLVGAGIALSLLFAAINPFFEELIVRAFLISEAAFLTGSVKLAVTFSVILQTAYHLYQGIPNAVGDGLIFLVLSLYYVKTRRLWPIVFAHFWLDFAAVISHLIRLQHH